MPEVREKIQELKYQHKREWQAWAESTADYLLGLEFDNRMQQIREFQNDLTDEAWWRLMKQSHAPSSNENVDVANRERMNGTVPYHVAAHSHWQRGEATLAQNGTDNISSNPGPGDVSHSDENEQRYETKGTPAFAADPEFEEEERTNRTTKSNVIYEVLVGLITIGLILSFLAYLVTDQLN